MLEMSELELRTYGADVFLVFVYDSNANQLWELKFTVVVVSGPS